MKLRYYLRGLGIGILVTVLFFVVSGGKNETMTDEEIKARALELGMVENSSLTLADIKNKQEVTSESVAPESIAVIESTESKNEKEITESSEPVKEELSSEDTNVESIENFEVSTESVAENAPSSGGNESRPPVSVSESTAESGQSNGTENVAGQDHITVTIERGQSSYGVSLMLEELGLVADAEDFDDYLCDMGYSKYVRYGVYHIAVGISEEELADIISGN